MKKNNSSLGIQRKIQFYAHYKYLEITILLNQLPREFKQQLSKKFQ
jgi:hypothetical protein